MERRIINNILKIINNTMIVTGKKLFILSLTMSVLLTSCVTLKEPSVIKNGNIADYQYVIINSTKSLTSSTGATINGYYYSTSKSINPSDVISGYLAKSGIIILPEIEDSLLEMTLIVNYGESGHRDVTFGYTTEVTIQFIDAKTKKLVAQAIAEGIGDTEADDIREAITRALNSLF